MKITTFVAMTGVECNIADRVSWRWTRVRIEHYAQWRLGLDGDPMTVCVAAICDGARVIGASDRMLTSGAIEFQPEQTKLVQLTTSIVAMVAGDMGIHGEVLSTLRHEIGFRIAQQPDNWWVLADVATLYENIYSDRRQRRCERDLLVPVGLTMESYTGRQRELSPDLVVKLATELLNYQLPTTEVIFAGVDPLGPHIYAASNGKAICQDVVGFAAIGTGAWHAASQFMVAQHSRNAALSKSLYLTFAAKKRAEIAPGVGAHTDMFLIGPQLGSYVEVRRDILDEFGRFYDQHRIRTQKLVSTIEGRVHAYIERLLEAAVEQTSQTAQAGDGETPTTGAEPRPAAPGPTTSEGRDSPAGLNGDGAVALNPPGKRPQRDSEG